MDKIRKPFQGVWNIVRFNWHFYVLSFALVIIIFLLRNRFGSIIYTALTIAAILVICSILISLLVSCYIYDFSELYNLSWLNNLQNKSNGKIVNVNAGFDETSELLKKRFPGSELVVFDFYEPSRHTEVSIKRARKAYPPFPGTQSITANHLPLPDSSTDMILAILSAHEIRNDDERVLLFKEFHRILIPEGKIVVTEHLRDTANFMAYNIGFFHFHSKATWVRTFEGAGFYIAKEIRITPFITTFILEKNGTVS